MIALLDACVLYPPSLRDLLMWLSTAHAYRPRWTAMIHEEWMRSFLADRKGVTREQLERTRLLMNGVDPESLVTGYEKRIPALTLPDAGDRHVLAAAIQANASVIVTFNLSDFPQTALFPYGMEALHPDVFLCQLLDEEEEPLLIGVRRHRASLHRPPKTVEDYLSTLQANRLAQFVTRLRAFKSEI